MEKYIAGQLPRYRCHKVVRAAKIVAIDHWERLDLMPYGVVEVGANWIAEKNAVVGGYFVEYEDGYTSFSPATAFEDGYRPILEPFNGIDIRRHTAVFALATVEEAMIEAAKIGGTVNIKAVAIRSGFSIAERPVAYIVEPG